MWSKNPVFSYGLDYLLKTNTKMNMNKTLYDKNIVVLYFNSRIISICFPYIHFPEKFIF